MPKRFPKLGAVLDKDAVNWLSQYHPEIVMALEEEVERGATPEALREFVVYWAGYNREDLARRIESAARHLTSHPE